MMLTVMTLNIITLHICNKVSRKLAVGWTGENDTTMQQST